MRKVWSTNADNQSRMERAKPLLEKFVMEPALKAHSRDWPSTEGHKNLLLYVDPEYDFVINAVVRVPGRKGSIHDHADRLGALRPARRHREPGAVRSYRRRQEARLRRAEARVGDDRQPGQGRHRAAARDPCGAGRRTRSVAIIVRSRKLGEGTILQGRYDPATKTRTEGYGPTQVPYELVA